MLAYLINQSRQLLTAAAIASVISGVCSVLLVIQINIALTIGRDESGSLLAWRFGVIAVAVMISHAVASVLFEQLSQRAHADLRLFISKRVISTDFRRLEEIGGPRVQSALSEHSVNVARFFVTFPAILVNTVIVICSLIYMAWLSWKVFLAAIVVIGLGSLGYHLVHLRAIKHLSLASKEQDILFDHFRSLVDGAKELRLHASKRLLFTQNVLGDSIETVRRERTLGMSIFVMSGAWGNFLIYAFIGLVLFVLVGDIPNRTSVMTGFALVFVYIVGPLENLLLALPGANLAKVSAQQIDEITQELEHGNTSSPDSLKPKTSFESLTLQGVSHSFYHEASDELFTLGPLDLSFSPGQITFLVGGNGSGKTTLAKLLVGLYKPEKGNIVLDGEAINNTNRDYYRQVFSAIFSDFYLFDRLLDIPSDELDDKGNALLDKLHLKHKVQVRNGAFTTRTLSQGQRKRLALVVACLEDRPFLVFDEWAADQDPIFKEAFYYDLLPELKGKGKSILVISHDDRYFHLADHLIRMEHGQLI